MGGEGSVIVSYVVCSLVRSSCKAASLGISVSIAAGRLGQSSALIEGESSCEVTRELHAIFFQTQSPGSAGAGFGHVVLLVVLCMSVQTEQVFHEFEAAACAPMSAKRSSKVSNLGELT